MTKDELDKVVAWFATAAFDLTTLFVPIHEDVDEEGRALLREFGLLVSRDDEGTKENN